MSTSAFATPDVWAPGQAIIDNYEALWATMTRRQALESFSYDRLMPKIFESAGIESTADQASVTAEQVKRVGQESLSLFFIKHGDPEELVTLSRQIDEFQLSLTQRFAVLGGTRVIVRPRTPKSEYWIKAETADARLAVLASRPVEGYLTAASFDPKRWSALRLESPIDFRRQQRRVASILGIRNGHDEAVVEILPAA